MNSLRTDVKIYPCFLLALILFQISPSFATEPATDPKTNSQESLQVSSTDNPSAAPEGTAKELFQSGVANYQKQEYQKASEELEQALMQDPDNPYILYNLGLASYRLKKTGSAVAYWRKALTLSPGMSSSRLALEFAAKENPSLKTGSSDSSWEKFRSSVLIKLSPSLFFVFTLICFAASGWLWMSYFGQRKRAFSEDSPLPHPPYVALIATLFFLLSSTLLASKLYDLSHPRGTIIEQNVQARSGPEASSSELFDIYETTEVILGRTQGEWIQVSFPGGLTGWIQRKQVIQTSGNSI